MHHEVNSLAYRYRGSQVFHHVMNLFLLHKWEREHPRRIVPTSRYREWIAKRDAQ